MEGTNKLLAGVAVIAALGLAWEAQKADPISNAPRAASAAPAPEGGIGAGETALLADGAARVFVSRVDSAAGTARVAVNGFDTVTLAVGETADTDACAVSLDAVGGGKASFSCNG